MTNLTKTKAALVHKHRQYLAKPQQKPTDPKYILTTKVPTSSEEL
jgi:hypothetical protein